MLFRVAFRHATKHHETIHGTSDVEILEVVSQGETRPDGSACFLLSHEREHIQESIILCAG